MNAVQNVNLARKLRPKTFDQVIGQGLSVKILQNSLYLKKYFPVYLFAGQRGCGKTTTARIFAAAVNCAQLSLFQQQPAQHPLPCLSCTSCLAMADGSHPDFIEIDAASHTGVDHVRQIIESAAYVPLIGQKKVYLIDEAHMLSKAAFNAFLKILEEPPQTVLFMLATTERIKIPETVLSRCFQLSFMGINHTQLREYLSSICKEEGMVVDDQALDLVIEETDGSVRDALNVLEQVRFSQGAVTQETIVGILGKVSNNAVIELLTLIIEQNPAGLLSSMKHISSSGCSAQVLWELVTELIRALVWINYGVEVLPNQFNRQLDLLKQLAAQVDIKRLHAMLSLLWQHELLFLQTAQKHLFLEMLLLQLCHPVIVPTAEGSLKQTSSRKAAPVASVSVAKPIAAQAAPTVTESTTPLTSPMQPVAQDERTVLWQQALNKIIEAHDDGFLHAILKQAVFCGYQADNGVLTLQLSNNGSFFKDKLKECIPACKGMFNEFFPGFAAFDFAESAGKSPTKPISGMLPDGASVQVKRNEQDKSKAQSSGARTLNVDDKEQWPSANLLLDHFPGVIKIEE